MTFAYATFFIFRAKSIDTCSYYKFNDAVAGTYDLNLHVVSILHPKANQTINDSLKT